MICQPDTSACSLSFLSGFVATGQFTLDNNGFGIPSIPSTLFDLSYIYILKEHYQKAKDELELILNTEGISFNDKNEVEEMLAFVKQKMNI